ncbi:beta-1,3-galactosyltransferase 4-like protein [Turdus rufiventris]|nr:beta-1,3-galactosyltransferase 4-like protein [Turdus rufiventris]
MPNGGVGVEKGGAGVVNGSGGVTNGDPGDGIGGPRVPPGCVGLLSGGSGDLSEGPPWLSRDPRTPRALLAPPPCAPPAPPFLLLLVPSAPAHRERRLAVRDTWGGSWNEPGTPPTRTVFVLGVPPGPDSQRELLSESRQHGDILQGDFDDSYANLTRKTLLLLRWARACCAAAPFLLKADDDVFVNVPAVATYLTTWPAAPPRLYLGRVHWGVAPDRDPRSRHHVPPGVYGAARYPPYCSGTAYVLSRQAATGVLGAAPAVPLAMPEDVWVGLGARRAGLAPRHSARFGGALRVPPERCCLGRALLSAHRVRPAELRRAWEELRELREEPRKCPGILSGALGRLRCRAMAWGERMWGTGEG